MKQNERSLGTYVHVHVPVNETDQEIIKSEDGGKIIVRLCTSGVVEE